MTGTIDTLRNAFARFPRSLATEDFKPLALTVAVSREAGSRGGTIARRAGRKLGWQVYNQELLEYLAQEKHLSQELFDALDEPAAAWIESRLEHLQAEQHISLNTTIVQLARVILAIGATGEALILGHGAGGFLPAASTLNVRIVAPLEDRIAYMSQFERLTLEEAAVQVRQRDEQRAEFIETHFQRKPSDLYQYDLLLNSSLLGEDVSAQLIERAALAKWEGHDRDEGAPPMLVPEMVE